jgi:hypothetical protein
MLIQLMALSTSAIPVLPSFGWLGIEYLVKDFGWLENVPWYLSGAAVTFAGLVAIHRPVIRWQGALLLERRCQILEAVTSIDS